MSPGPVSRFIDRHSQHVNAAPLKDAGGQNWRWHRR